MLWLLIVYPWAWLVAALTLLAFGIIAFQVPEYPALGIIGCLLVATVGITLSIRVARWEARRRGGTGHEGSGPIEPRGPGGPTR